MSNQGHGTRTWNGPGCVKHGLTGFICAKIGLIAWFSLSSGCVTGASGIKAGTDLPAVEDRVSPDDVVEPLWTCEGRLETGMIGQWNTALLFHPETPQPGQEEEECCPSLSWEDGPVLIPKPDMAFSSILPTTDPAFGLAVIRRTLDQDPEADPRSVLIRLDTRTLAVNDWWNPGLDFTLLGRVRERAILLVNHHGWAEIAAVDPAARDIWLSGPLELDDEALSSCALSGGCYGAGLDVPVRYVAPMGGNRFAFLSDSGAVGLVRIGEDGMVVEPSIPMDASRLCISSDGDLQIMVGLSGSLPSVEMALSAMRSNLPELCEYEQTGLPVDGVFTGGVPVEIDACLVQPELVLPSLDHTSDDDHAEWSAGGITALSWARDWRWPDTFILTADLLVMGETLGLGHARSSPAGGPMFSIALRPDDVGVTRVTVGSYRAYRAQLHIEYALESYYLCLYDLVFRTSGPVEDGTESKSGFANFRILGGSAFCDD